MQRTRVRLRSTSAWAFASAGACRARSMSMAATTMRWRWCGSFRPATEASASFRLRARQPLPPFATQSFQRMEFGFVIHLLAAANPVAEVDVRKTTRFRFADMIDDHVGAEAAHMLAGMEEAVDH